MFKSIWVSLFYWDGNKNCGLRLKLNYRIYYFSKYLKFHKLLYCDFSSDVWTFRRMKRIDKALLLFVNPSFDHKQQF